MPVTYEIRDMVVVVELTGDYIHSDVAAGLVRAGSDARFKPGSALLVDASHSQIALSDDELAARIELFSVALRRLQYGPRIAVVPPVDQPERVRGLTHFVAALCAQRFEARLFTNRDEAARWLGMS